MFKDRLQDYKTREEGCITKMLADLEFYLKERRSMNRLIFFYKVVERLVQPIPPEDFLKLIRQKDTKQYSDDQSSNIIGRQVKINNDNCFIVEKAKTEQYKHSFFIRTTIEWIISCMQRQLLSLMLPSTSVTNIAFSSGVLMLHHAWHIILN